ncbi:MAG: tetratricopeptide repeat protein [Nitrospirae bacterium]|nr:tetratricopeptide repeat protein [Nitrospirota bacterium]
MKKIIKILPLVVLAFLFLTATAFAEKVTFVKEYNYNASDLDSKVSSRTIALEQVKRLLLEELGTYLISETEVKNFRLTKDQVTTYSAGVVSAEVVDERWDGKTYYLKAKVSADPAEVAKSLQNIVNDKQKTKELEDVRKKATEFSKEIERLKKELEIAKADTKKPAYKADEKKIEQYNEAVKGLSATDWFKKGLTLGKAGNHQEALNAFNKAIELNPQDTATHYNRGTAYSNLGNYQQAINDFNKAIGLNPQDAEAYNNRGVAYSNLGNYQQAINDLTKVIELNPQYDAKAYNNRGFAYAKLENYQKAIKDFNKTIELNPQDAEAYYNRGVAYGMLGNHQQAIKDFNKAIQLDPKDASAYYNRGAAYAQLKNYQKTIEDYEIAARLGHKKAQDFLREQGIKW